MGWVDESYQLGVSSRPPKLSLWSVGRSIRTVAVSYESGHQDYRLGWSAIISRLSPRFGGLVTKTIVLAGRSISLRSRRRVGSWYNHGKITLSSGHQLWLTGQRSYVGIFQQDWVGGRKYGRVSTLGGSWLSRVGPTGKVEGEGGRIATSISLVKR